MKVQGQPDSITAYAQKMLDDLKNKNYQELQSLLDKEEKEENERERRVANVSEEERNKLEKVFGIERAAASERIVILTKKHEKAEKKLSKQLGLSYP
mmetsp:Transcript_18396/g.18371  ORF Transcript_18396/g.18371 Transcript_18396/m.18371 type:complete len:97 (+) Transcript_18396:1289-1579(+)